MNLKILIYGFIAIFIVNLNSCATYNQRKFNEYVDRTNSIIINDIQNIYINEYKNKVANIDSILSIDDIKQSSSTDDLLNKYYKKNKNNEKQDNVACLNINKNIDKFFNFIKKIKNEIDSHIKIQDSKYKERYSSYSFDYKDVPTEIKENIYNSLGILNSKKNSITQVGYNYEKELYDKNLQKNKKYQTNKKQIENKQNKKDSLYDYIMASNFCSHDPYYMPDNIKNHTLYTDDMVVLQVIPNGILAIQNIPREYQYGYNDLYLTWNQLAYGHKGTEYPAIFIKTNKNFIVGQRINEYIRYTGKNFTYPTTYGTATVMVFNIVTDYSKKQNQYFSLEEEIENLQKKQTEIESDIKKDFYFYK